MEREIVDLRSLQRKLGDAVGLAVDALLQDEDAKHDAETLKRIKNRKREAVESLAYVRDVLKGTTTEVDEERLYGEEEYVRRRSSSSLSGRNETDPNRSPPPRPPEPVVAAPPPSEHRRQRSTPTAQTSSYPITSLPRTPAVVQSHRPRQEPIATERAGNASTLPRQKVDSQQSNSTLQTDQYHAPWNYTRTNFSTPAVDYTALPRPPPRTSLTPVAARSDGGGPARQARKASNDPLGALSP